MTYEPFHIRERNRQREGETVIYQYEKVPSPLRVQIFRILQRVIGDPKQSGGTKQQYIDPTNEPFGPRIAWRTISSQISDETGFSTAESEGHGDFYGILFIAKNYPDVYSLTSIEIAFRMVAVLPKDYQSQFRLSMSPQQAIEELNRRFRQHDVGYAFETDRLVRIDSQYIHSQVVDPALQLLNENGFSGAQHEFLSAHSHFRQGENDDAVVDAARAFESTLKSICDQMNWKYSEGAAAKELIRVTSDHGLFPKWHENHLNSLRSLLEGLPTVRNKNGGHGSGSMFQAVPEGTAAFAIHLAASNIVFLVDCFKDLK